MVIQHVVVIFDENESFDHYFGTYPNAQNLSGETPFTAAAGTPTPNNFITNPTLLTANPNASNTANATGAINPFRLPPADAYLVTQSHSYAPEQQAFDNGAMDLFPASVGASNAKLTSGVIVTSPAQVDTSGLTMGYFDGNTVTALWNYAQHYAISDHFFGTTFGPSTIGAINLISGQTNGAVNAGNATSALLPDGSGGYTVDVDAEPPGDTCSTGGSYYTMTGPNIGNLLTAANVSWGWFQGGFNLAATNPPVPGSSVTTTNCQRTSYSSVMKLAQQDYVSRHEPFQFYTSTQNLLHTRPTSTALIGTNSDAGNHQYDSNDFLTALAAGNMPAVSYLKPPAYQDSHASNSDPLDEQTWIVTMVNAIEASPFWQNTAIIIAYDDSDGWYDHLNYVVNGSSNATTGADSAICSSNSSVSSANALPGVTPTTLHAQGRCGHGSRLPLLVISPWANKNYVDSTPIDQTSILRFIEDTFLKGQRLGSGSYDSVSGSMNGLFNFTSTTPPNPNVVLLNPATGVVTTGN